MIKRLYLGAIDEPLENNGAIADSGERTRCNRKVVAYQIELGDPHLRLKIQFVRMCYQDFASLDREELAGCFFRH